MIAERKLVLFLVARNGIGSSDSPRTIPNHIRCPGLFQNLRRTAHGPALIQLVQVVYHLIDQFQCFYPFFFRGVFQQDTIMIPGAGVDKIISSGRRKWIFAGLDHESD